MASRLGPAHPRGIGWKGAGDWLIFSQARPVNFSRTVWITFHCRGTTSSVSVTSSPIFTIRSDPQQVQAAGASTTTRSRGRCSGKAFLTGLRRSKPATFVVFSAACSARALSSAASATSSSSCNSSWSMSRAVRSALRPYLSRLRIAISSLSAAIIASEVDTAARACARSASAAAALPSAAASAERSCSSSEAVSDMVKTYHADPHKPMGQRLRKLFYPAFAGRCVQRGLRQSIPSRR